MIFIQEAKGDSSKLFSFVNKLVGKSKQRIYPDGEEQCMEFFFSKIEKIRDGFEKSCKFVPTEVKCASFDFDIEVTQEEVRAIIRKSKATTCRNSPVPSYLVKHNNDVLLPAITHLVNLSLCGGVFPDCLKMAIISALLKKKGLDIILSNFRPVSNLTCISKIIEKAAAGFFNAHMEREVLLPFYQSAYCANHSTETLLLRLYNDILHNMEGQCVTSVITIDLSAAFDTVENSILMNVLSSRFKWCNWKC